MTRSLKLVLAGYFKHLLIDAIGKLEKPHSGLRHLLFTVCDHYEPAFQSPPMPRALARVQRWVTDYPAMAARFGDADGRPPQHTFFVPGEEFRPEFFDALETLVRARLAEVELRLHHESFAAPSLRAEIRRHLATYAGRGHLARGADGRARYAFIRPGGKTGAVDAELPLLFETGCYADFSVPSAQPKIVNQIYWPTGAVGQRARTGESFSDRILLMQGPLAFSLREGGAWPRLESGAISAADPPSAARLACWVRQNIHVEGRPDWVFVKLFTQGAPEEQAECLLGGGARALHGELTTRYNDGVRWKLHYVTAREAYNVAKAAMAGKRGDPNDYRDYELPRPPIQS